MGPELLAIADGMVAALNAHAFDSPYNAPLGAVRLYVPVFALKDLSDLKVRVAVVGRGKVGEVISRGKDQAVDYAVDVGIVRRVPGKVAADIDALMRLVEQVTDFLVENPLTGLVSPTTRAIVTGYVNDPVYDPKVLDEEEQFISAPVFTYRAYR